MAVRLVAFDGHDCSGKTTLARRVADALGGIYARPYRPEAGAAIVRAWRSADVEQVRRLAQVELDRFVEWVQDRDADALVLCDRYVVSAMALGGDGWVPRAPHATTVLCTVDVASTVTRELDRGSPLSARDINEQHVLVRRYEVLGDRLDLPTIDSVALDLDAATARALGLAGGW